MISDDNVSSFLLQIAHLIKNRLRWHKLLNWDKPYWHGVCTHFFQMECITLLLQCARALSRWNCSFVWESAESFFGKLTITISILRNLPIVNWYTAICIRFLLYSPFACLTVDEESCVSAAGSYSILTWRLRQNVNSTEKWKHQFAGT